MSRAFPRIELRSVEPTAAEVAAPVVGDDLVPDANVVMDRGFTVAAPPAVVWPWLVQLGKGRAGWYLPRAVERFLPPGNRATRVVESRWQDLAPGDVVPDYGRGATLETEVVEAPRHLVFGSTRGHVAMSWAIALTPVGADATRVHLRLRLGGVRRPWLAHSAGELFDASTIAGMAAGLRERLGS